MANIKACTVDNFEHVLNGMNEHIFLVHAYRDQKHYIHYSFKEPIDVCVRGFLLRVQELNDYIDKFPAGAPNVPAVSLDEDGVKDIIFCA